MFPDRIIKKVPGQIPKSSQESQGYLDNLEKLSVIALTEVLERQTKLLEDRVFIKKLPDRGDRIQKLKERLENEIRRRDEVSDVCQVMSGLAIDGKELSERLEWRQGDTGPAVEEHQSAGDLDEGNPFKILATHSGAGFHKKTLIIEKEPEPLIKPSDLIDIEEDEAGPHNEPYVEVLCNKIDAQSPKERFLPFKTLVNRKEVSADKIRDVTAASPPVPKRENVKQLPLLESLQLQAEQAKHLREVQMKHAAEKLREKGTVCLSDALPPTETTAHYRESPPSDSEEEVIDEDAKEESGGVVFPLSNS